MRWSLAALVLALSVFASSSKADMIFSTTGVWRTPRIYKDNRVHTGPVLTGVPYTIKTRVVNDGPTTDTAILTGEITGQQNYQWSNGPVTLPSLGVSTRQHTYTFPSIEERDITYRLDNGNSTTLENVNVTPEPTTVLPLSLAAGATAIIRRKRRKQISENN
jgi:hypothetical protein